MTTMGSRPYENINSSRFNANSKKSKRLNNSHFDFTSKPRTNYDFTKNCTIHTIYQHEFVKPTYYKFHSQSEEYLDSRKYNYTAENNIKYSHSYNSCKYDRSFKSNSSSSFEKNARNSQLSTASESESTGSSGSNSSSELSGFKIVQEGRIVHNESEEELDSPKLRKSMSMEETANCWNYASSLMVAGPNVREISIPTFM